MFSPGSTPGTSDDRAAIGEAIDDGTDLTIDLRQDEAAIAAKLMAVTRLRDPNLADHAQRTADIAVAVAVELDLDAADVDRVHLGAQLHDIGKLGVAEAILWKPAGLSRSEWREVRTHPEEGHRLVADVVHRDVASAVLYHHERIDGDGYPFGIDGRTLPIAVRIVQVADAFDAMTSERPYQRALPTTIAVAEIGRCAGSQFDPDVADALARVFEGREDRFPPIERPRILPDDHDAPPGTGGADPFDLRLDRSA